MSSALDPQDLSELELVLQISERKFVSIRVNPDWTARIEIPPSIELPRDVDLPILVYRVPRNASQVVNRWEVVGHARANAQ